MSTPPPPPPYDNECRCLCYHVLLVCVLLAKGGDCMAKGGDSIAKGNDSMAKEVIPYPLSRSPSPIPMFMLPLVQKIETT